MFRHLDHLRDGSSLSKNEGIFVKGRPEPETVIRSAWTSRTHHDLVLGDRRDMQSRAFQTTDGASGIFNFKNKSRALFHGKSQHSPKISEVQTGCRQKRFELGRSGKSYG